MVESDLIVSRNPEVISTEVGGEVALMSISKGQYYGLDSIAATSGADWSSLLKSASSQLV